MSSEDEEILHEFLIEGFEGLDQLDQDFVLLEDGPSDPEIIKRIFRTIHTIKGTCGFLELKKLESITHLGETLLDGMRTGEVKVEPQAITVLLSMIDSVRSIMQQLQDHGTEGDDDFSALKEDLKAAREKKSSQEEPMTGKDEDSSIEKEQESVSEDAISEDIAEMLADQSSSPEAPAAPEEVVESSSSSEQGAEPKLSENLEISDELIRTVMEHESEEGAAEEGAA
ncbi:Hpt domain-containing protein, partial [bacterium]|nr:Hpt domain-containing protein [bacterium]